MCWPARGVVVASDLTLIVPFPPGGSTDFTARVLAVQLQPVVRRPVVIETHAGNFGIDAIRQVVDRAPGGTLMVGTVNTNSITPVFRKDKMPFDYAECIAPVSRLAAFPSVISASAGSPYDTLIDLFFGLRDSAGRVRYSTDFLGSNVDVDMVMLSKAMEVEIAYRSTGGALEILAELEAGRVDLCILNVGTALLTKGRHKPLAVVGPRRIDMFPSVPTLSEEGFPSIGTSNWQGCFISRQVSNDALAEMHRSVVRAIGADGARERFADIGAEVVTSASPESFAAEIVYEMARWVEMESAILGLPEVKG
jgi:tripartite-type tricarboxylate transporter receptor subunit TctC